MLSRTELLNVLNLEGRVLLIRNWKSRSCPRILELSTAPGKRTYLEKKRQKDREVLLKAEAGRTITNTEVVQIDTCNADPFQHSPALGPNELLLAGERVSKGARRALGFPESDA